MSKTVIKPTKSWDQQFAKALLEASSAKSFLACFLANKRSKNLAKITYASLMRSCAFPSRGYARNLVLGKRRITALAEEKLIKGLALEPLWAQYFHTLVETAASHPRDVREKSMKKLKGLKSRLEEKYDLKASSPLSKHIHAEENSLWSKIFAALGENKTGAGLKEILEKTKLPHKKAQAQLDTMIAKGLVVFDAQSSRFIAQQNHWLTIDESNQDKNFSMIMAAKFDDAKRMARRHPSSDKHLFFASTFSCNHESMNELKQRLRELLIEFVDESELDRGKALVDLTLFFGPMI